MAGQSSSPSHYPETNIPDYQKMLQTSTQPDSSSRGQLPASGWHDDVETLTPSPVIHHPQAPVSPPTARRFQHHAAWDGGGRMHVGSKIGGMQLYHPSIYGHTVDEIYDGYPDYPEDIYSTMGYGYYGEGVNISGAQETGSPALMRHIYNRTPVPAEQQRSFPDSSQVQHLLDDFTTHSGNVREGVGGGGGGGGGGSTSGYGSSSYDNPASLKTPPHRKSELAAHLSTAKPRSILRNNHNQSQLGRDMTASPLFSRRPEVLHFAGSTKKTAGDLRQWQQQHQEELLHQHIETQALYEKQLTPLDSMIQQLGIKEDDPSRWEPIRRAADNIIREKNMIIEKLRQRVLELEQDLKMADNKLRQAVLASDDKADLVHQKLKELQYKNATLKTELTETRTKKNAEINILEEQLGAAEHELEQLRSLLKNKDTDAGSVEAKLHAKEREIEEWGRRFQEMKSSHHQLRVKLDSVERYLTELPTVEESTYNAQELLRLKEENTLSKSHIEELQQKLTQTRKLLVARDLRVKELEDVENELAGRLQELEQELHQVREKDEMAQSLLHLETELSETKQEKERLSVDLEKAKKLLETTHRRLRQQETHQHTEMTEVKERLTQEEEAVETLRHEVLDREQQLEKMKHLLKDLSNQNQDLMERNLILREQLTQAEQHAADDVIRLQRRLMAELGQCFSELQAIVQICLQRARGEDPNMSVLLGVRDAVADTEETCVGATAEDKGQAIKQWLAKLSKLRQDVDGLRAAICNQYAEDMGQTIQCATQ